MTTKIAGRHRMPVRPRTPLTTIGDAVSTSATTVSRRSAVIAASSGLMVTMGLPAAGATPLLHSSTPDPSTGASTQQPAPDASRVSAPKDAQVSFALSSLTSVNGAQYEHDTQVASAERLAATTQVSRSAVRTDDSGDLSPSTGSSAPTIVAPSPSSSTAPVTTAPVATAPVATAPVATAAGTKTVALVAAGSAAVDLARRYIGIRYRYGGTTPAGFDCSGFVQYVYGQLGVQLPRTASQQSQSGTRISASDAQPGDIVSFYGAGGVYHNGIYAGDGNMINSPRTGERLQEQPIWSSQVVFTRVSS